MIRKYGNVISLVSEIKEHANRYIVRKMTSLGIEGLVTSHGSILINLYLDGPSRMADIALKIKKKKNTVTTLVDKLVKHGYVKIGFDADDQRVKVVELTEKGMSFKEDFFQISNDLIDKTFAGIAEEERHLIISFLNKMRDNLK